MEKKSCGCAQEKMPFSALKMISNGFKNDFRLCARLPVVLGTRLNCPKISLQGGMDICAPGVVGCCSQDLPKDPLSHPSTRKLPREFHQPHNRQEWGIQRVKNSSYLTTLPLLNSISLPDCLWRKLNWFSSASEAFTVSEGS